MIQSKNAPTADAQRPDRAAEIQRLTTMAVAYDTAMGIVLNHDAGVMPFGVPADVDPDDAAVLQYANMDPGFVQAADHWLQLGMTDERRNSEVYNSLRRPLAFEFAMSHLRRLANEQGGEPPDHKYYFQNPQDIPAQVAVTANAMAEDYVRNLNYLLSAEARRRNAAPSVQAWTGPSNRQPGQSPPKPRPPAPSRGGAGSRSEVFQ